VLGLALAGLCAPAAHASNVNGSGAVNYFAAPGETNNVTVSLTPAGFVVNDPGATITPAGGCVANGPNQATCPSTDVTQIRVSLGDLNDRAAIDASVPPLSSEISGDPSVELVGGEGDDVLSGGVGTENRLFGDFDFGPEANTDGADTLTGGDGHDELVGGGKNDMLNGGAGDDEFIAGGGNDVMNGGDGFDRFDGGTGPDGADVVNGGRDLDSYNASDREGSLHITLDGSADDGEGCPGAGCEGDNVKPDVERLQTGDGSDVLVGEPGSDDLSSGDGNDSVDGGGGDDAIFAGRGNDVAHGGAGGDLMGGQEGTDKLFGDAGDDGLFSAAFDDDPDRLSGGKGTDYADYRDAGSAVSVRLDNKANDGVAGEGDNVLADTEDVFGSRFADVLIGSKAANLLDGGDGNDRLIGKAGADGLIGGRGADRLVAGKGADLLDGGAAPDRLNSRDGRGDEVRCGSSFDRVKGDRSDRLSGDCDKVALKGRR
jgi:Ca2+-binding RTX toxin-like protein